MAGRIGAFLPLSPTPRQTPPRTWPEELGKAVGGGRGRCRGCGLSRQRPPPACRRPSHSALPAPDITPREAGSGKAGARGGGSAPPRGRREGAQSQPRASKQPGGLTSRPSPSVRPSSLQRPVSGARPSREARAGRGATSGGCGQLAPGKRAASPRTHGTEGGSPPLLGEAGAEARPYQQPTGPRLDDQGADFPPTLPSSPRIPNSTSPPPDCFLRLFALRQAGKVWGGARAAPLASANCAPGALGVQGSPVSWEGPGRLGAPSPASPSGRDGLRPGRVSGSPPPSRRRLRCAPQRRGTTSSGAVGEPG